MAVEVFTPFNRSKPERVDLATKRFRKQILRPGEFDYTDDEGKQRKLKFDLSYFNTLKKAFDDKAFDSVAFQFTDGTNSHNVGPDYTRGVLVEMEEPSDKGLWGQFEIDEAGVKQLSANPELGVSARIFENLRHADGRAYQAAVHQVLGTTDPVITGMEPWQAVELSRPMTVSSTIDLSGREQNKMPKNDDDQTVLKLSTAQREKLLTLLEDVAGAEELEKLINGDPDDDDENEPDDDDREPVVDKQTQIKLSRAEARIAELERLNLEQAVDKTLGGLVLDGLAPAIVDLARPLLLEPGQTVIELSRDGRTEKATTGAVVKELLTTVLKLARDGLAVVGLNEETGELLGSDAEMGKTKALVDAWENQFPD